VQVVLDGARADEQPCADLRIREAVRGEPGDLGLLGGQPVAGALARRRAGRVQLALGPRGERMNAHPGEHGMGGAQVVARIGAAPLAPQPLAVEEVGTCELDAQSRASEPGDRLAVARLLAADQRA
jgi:hypothetical protein